MPDELENHRKDKTMGLGIGHRYVPYAEKPATVRSRCLFVSVGHLSPLRPGNAHRGVQSTFHTAYTTLAETAHRWVEARYVHSTLETQVKQMNLEGYVTLEATYLIRIATGLCRV